MAVYRILVKKQVQWHEWTNSYVIVTSAPYSRDELLMIADTVAPRFVAFERYFHSEDVRLTETLATPLLDLLVTNIFGQRAANRSGGIETSVAGLRPIAIDASTGPILTLVLGLQPVRNHWGSKDYRYALSRDEVQATPNGYQLDPEAYKEFQRTLVRAKQELLPLLQANPQTPSFAISATQNVHDPQVYQYRYVRDIIIKGVHISKHRRR